MKEEEVGLSPREIALLRCLRDGEQPRREVARALGMSQPELTRLVKSLESKGIVVVRRNGMSSSLSFSELKHASVLRRILNEYSHMSLEEVLSLASLRVIASLAIHPESTREKIQVSSGVSPRTIHTVLSRFKAVGIIRVHGRGVYELSDRFALFAEFARELMSFSNQKKALAFSSDSVVIWERGGEFAIRTKARKESEGFRKTAFSAFDSYGLPLVQEWHYYYHPHGSWRRTPDEVLLQSLLIRPLGSREINALKMLWDRKTLWRNIDQLIAKAGRYGVTAELMRLIEGFKGHEKNNIPVVSRSGQIGQKLRSGGR
jgi:DNA-binding MarR family transcriptional regulator